MSLCSSDYSPERRGGGRGRGGVKFSGLIVHGNDKSKDFSQTRRGRREENFLFSALSASLREIGFLSGSPRNVAISSRGRRSRERGSNCRIRRSSRNRRVP